MNKDIKIQKADYEIVKKFADKHFSELFNEPTEISPNELFYGFNEEKLSDLRNSFTNKRYGFFLYEKEKVIGWHLGVQSKRIIYNMVSSAIIKEFQGNGYYNFLLAKIISFAKSEGYVAITSSHSATNNQVLVPKLKQGFYIQGIEIQNNFGLAVNLIYYLNDNQKNIHEMRVGSRKGDV